MVITALFLLMFGITEFGWYLWTANALQQTVVQTARCMGVLQSNCAPGRAYSSTSTVSYAQQVASSYGVTVPSSGVVPDASTTCAGAANFSQVTINYTFQSVVPNLITSLSSASMTESACFPNQS